jgi:hypothetical protein
MSEEYEQALANVGGEPLAGSGFEDEAPQEGFSDNATEVPQKQPPRAQ